jgi:hypothetical protein
MLIWSRRLLIRAAAGSVVLCLALISPARAEVNCQEVSASPYNPPGRVCASGLPSDLLQIPAVSDHQHQSQWCWAASISMVFSYYGHPVSQERIIRETYGYIVNMPAQPWTMLGALNRSWVDDQGQPFQSMSSPGSTNPVAAAQDLAMNMPLIIGTLGHAVVLTGLQYAANYMNTPLGPQLGPVFITRAVVRDPWPGRGSRELSSGEWPSISFAVQIRVE